MFGKNRPVIAACAILVLGLVACATPAGIEPTAMPPEAPTVVVTSVVTPTPEPTPMVVTATPEPTPVVVTVVVVATSTPTAPTETPVPPTETPVPPTQVASPEPQATATSAGPLDFAEPSRLDHWEPLDDGGYECTIFVHITGGTTPYTVHHDLDLFTTWDSNPPIVFKARECSRIVHTITVESADGQTVSHDYSIPPPWCE